MNKKHKQKGTTSSMNFNGKAQRLQHGTQSELCTVLLLLLLFGTFSAAWAATDVSGTVWGSWTKANSPYNVVGDILTADLTIQPGVEVVFQGNYAFEVGGVLKAVGTSDEPIAFTRISGGWQGIFFNYCPAGSAMAYCMVSNSVNSGVRIVNAIPTFTNCCFVGNSGTGNGGGISAQMPTGDLVLHGCTFLANTCASHGAGLAASVSTGKVLMTECNFTGNRANPTDRYGGYVGGGVCVWGNAELFRCTFDSNSSYSMCNDTFGCAITGRGGAAYFAGNTVVQNCAFYNNFCRGNEASGWSFYGEGYAYGGAIYLESGSLLLYNTVLSDNTLVAYGNATYYRGGGVYVNGGVCEVVNSTCVYNAAEGIYAGGGSTSVTNSILYFNTGNELGGTPTVSYCDVQGGYSGEGNIDFQPIFQSRTNLQIVPGSRCIDAGHPDPVFNDACFPPSLGSVRNDIGAHGGPGACAWNDTCTPPEIVRHPMRQSSCLGYGATFTVTAAGSEPLTYQWFHDGTLMPGQIGPNLSLTNLQASDAGVYTVMVSNGCGDITSTPAALLIYDACVDIHMYAGLTIAGQVGQTYVLKYTTDLNNTNFATWTPLATNTMGASDWFYLDMDSPFSPKRFYGVRRE